MSSPGDPPSQAGIGFFLIAAIVIGVIVVATIVGLFVATDQQPAPPAAGATRTNPLPQPVCFAACAGVVQLECPTNRVMNVCLGIVFCDAKQKPHVCGTNPP